MSKDSKPRRQRTDAARNRTAILEAAEAVLAEDGAALSTEEVARRASVGIGTVFRHFPTKAELLRAVVAHRLEALAAEAQAIGDDAEADALFRFFEHVVAQAAKKQTLVHALSAIDVDASALLDEAGAAFRDAVAALVARGQKRKLIRRDIDAAAVLELLLAVAHVAERRGESGRAAVQVVLDGLRPVTRRGGPRAPS